MAAPDAIRKALLALLGAKKVNKGKQPSERSFRTQFEDTDDFGNPTVNEMTNQVPTARQAEQLTIEGPGRGDAFGTFVDDPKGLAVRQGRLDARNAQRSDPLAVSGERDMFFNSLSPEEAIKARALARDFEAITGRPPTDFELKNPSTMQRIIDSINGPETSIGVEDIPF